MSKTRKLIVQTYTLENEQLEYLLKKHGLNVNVYTNEWDYQEMEFPAETFKETFFQTMQFLFKKNIRVYVLDILVKLAKPIDGETHEKFNSEYHAFAESYIDYFDNIEKDPNFGIFKRYIEA